MSCPLTHAFTYSGRFYDSGGNGYACALYTPLSLASSSEVTSANAAGVPGSVGQIFVATPVSGGLATRRIVGVAAHSCRQGQDVTVITGGVIKVLANAAIAAEAIVTAAATETRTDAQTPFTSSNEMMIPHDPRNPLSYTFSLIDDTGLTVATTGSNTLYYPLGVALKAASAKYDLIPVDISAVARLMYA